MHNWRSGRWLVLITVLLILCCIVQRSMGAHVISERLASAVSQTQSSFSTPIAEQQNASEGKYSLSTCELSAKSLLAANSMAVEHLFFALLLFVALLLEPARRLYSLIPPPRAVSLPRLRVHLRLCVFRE